MVHFLNRMITFVCIQSHDGANNVILLFAGEKMRIKTGTGTTSKGELISNMQATRNGLLKLKFSTEFYLFQFAGLISTCVMSWNRPFYHEMYLYFSFRLKTFQL